MSHFIIQCLCIRFMVTLPPYVWSSSVNCRIGSKFGTVKNFAANELRYFVTEIFALFNYGTYIIKG